MKHEENIEIEKNSDTLSPVGKKCKMKKVQSKENNERKSETLKESNTEKCNIERIKYKESAT